MIKRFSCRNFRNVSADAISFSKINLMIGPNNSGKSNFIRAITFLSEMLNKSNQGNLRTSFLNALSRNGWEHSLRKGADEFSTVDFSWEIMLEEMPLVYNFSYSVSEDINDCHIMLEQLDNPAKSGKYNEVFNYFRCHDDMIGSGYFSTSIKKGNPNQRLNFMINSKETIIRQMRDLLLHNQALYDNLQVRVDIAKLLSKLEEYFMGFRVYACTSFDSERIKKPSEIKTIDDVLKEDGSNFANIFNYYKSQDISWKTDFENKMRELIPELRTADAVIQYDKLYFRLVMGDSQYDLSDVSEGTIKSLILNIIINAPSDNTFNLVAIDEPETNMHPAWQKVVANWLQCAGTFRQCFISTHSPDFLDSFTEGFKCGEVSVFVFDNIKGIKKIQYDDIKNELGDWELGDLYRTNDPALGGWPW